MRYRDGQFVASLALSCVAGVLFLSALWFLVWRTGFAGLLTLLGIAAGGLWWFYRGGRSDLPAGRSR